MARVHRAKEPAMILKVMSWNMAGARVFGKLDGAPYPVAGTYIRDFRNAWENETLHHLHAGANAPGLPDVMLLQECVGFVDHRPEPSHRWQTGKQILQAIFPGYECFFFPAFSSHTHPYPGRWNVFRRGGGSKHYLPDAIEAQQGYGVCVLNPGQLRRLWVDEPDPQKASLAPPPGAPTPGADHPGAQANLCFEAIHTTTGLYLGSRDTEPRRVVFGRLKVPDGPSERYVNFLNVHLTTLQGEREGNIGRDRLGSRVRMAQVDLILDNVISAYQEAHAYRIPRAAESRKQDLWIMAGDFNAAPDSEELELIRRVGFVDGNPDKRLSDSTGAFHGQIGTKWSARDSAAPPIAVDYILCGLQASAFPMGGVDLANSLRPYRPRFAEGSAFEPDHAVVFASFEIP
jgi:hypothetical protein